MAMTTNPNERAARFCGLAVVTSASYNLTCPDWVGCATLRMRRDEQDCGIDIPKEANVEYRFASDEQVPDFANDANVWPQVWADLERRGLMRRFAEELLRVQGWIIEWKHIWENHDVWLGLITATPAQRLAALMKVLEEVECETNS